MLEEHGGVRPTNTPLVSIGIVTYNQEDYIGACIDSALAQDYRPIQIIVADDASTDRTQEIIREYAAAHPGVVVPVFAAKNGGITPNSTAAFHACEGKYIAWMGGDDLMLPGKIGKQVARMEQDASITICYHDLDVFESSTNQTLALFSQTNTPREGDLDTVLRHGVFNGACSTMVRRDRSPDGFDMRTPYSSDWLFWIMSLGNGGRIVYIDEVLGRYRRHSANITSNASFNKLLVLDHFVTCGVALVHFPALVSSICWSLARLMVHYGRRTPTGKVGLFVMAAGLLGVSILTWPIGRLARSARK